MLREYKQEIEKVLNVWLFLNYKSLTMEIIMN